MKTNARMLTLGLSVCMLTGNIFTDVSGADFKSVPGFFRVELQADNLPEVIELSQFLASTVIAGQINAQQDISLFKKLLYGVNPAIYIRNSQVKATQEIGCKVLDVNASDLNPALFSVESMADIELLRIRINRSEDFSASLSKQILDKLPSLKFVYFDSSIEQTAQGFNSMIASSLPQTVRAVYGIAESK
jgi:hypothetical protein